jgi:antitoxin ParD1/3/4
MTDPETISVDLPPELASFVRESVARGEYPTASDAVREAVAAWRRRSREHQAFDAELGQLWDEGLASGPAGDGAAAFRRIRRALGAVAGLAVSVAFVPLP